MVSMLAVPLAVGTTLYQMVLTLPVGACPLICEHAGVGSFVSVVAPELSLVSVNEVEVMLIAPAKLSLAGAGATTVKVGRVTVCVVKVAPPPGGGFSTPTELVLPKFAIKAAGTVAVSCVALTNVVVILVKLVSGLRITFELVWRFVPVTVMSVSGEFTGALTGATLEIVGGWPITVKGREFVVFAPSLTLTCTTAPPARSPAAKDAVSCVALTNVVALALLPHITVEVDVKPVPFTVSVVADPGALAVNGESLLIRKVGVFGPAPRLMSHTPRPCIAARSVRDGL